jgi:hypothetical protein
MNRRDFLRASAGLALAGPALPAAPAPIRITELKFLHLRYPAITPRKRNGTIASGGGPAGMTQLELNTDAGIVGRSIYSGGREILTAELMPASWG